MRVGRRLWHWVVGHPIGDKIFPGNRVACSSCGKSWGREDWP